MLLLLSGQDMLLYQPLSTAALQAGAGAQQVHLVYSTLLESKWHVLAILASHPNYYVTG